jgi:hypothetical protein
VGENHVSAIALFFLSFGSVQLSEGHRIVVKTYWPSCRMLSLIDGVMDGEEWE